MPLIYVMINAEDALLEMIAKRLLKEYDKYRIIGSTIEGGSGNIDKKIKQWNNAANNGNVRLVLRDMDSLAFPENPSKCPATLINEKLKSAAKSGNLLFRIAVAESENWLLADIDNLCHFLGCPRINSFSPDKEVDGKKCIIRMAKRSKNSGMKRKLVPTGSTSPVGPGWNDILSEFIKEKWNPQTAAQHSKSLRRTLDRLRDFHSAA